MRLDRSIRRAIVTLAGVALLAATIAAPAGAATETVSGTLVIREKVSLSSNAVAVVTLVDQTAGADAGAILGQQRLDAPGQAPIAYSVAYDGSLIKPKHSYALFASVIDGSKVWQAPAAGARDHGRSDLRGHGEPGRGTDRPGDDRRHDRQSRTSRA